MRKFLLMRLAGLAMVLGIFPASWGASNCPDAGDNMYVISITKVISDQLGVSGVEVNSLPVGDGKAGFISPNNPMIMATRSDSKAYLIIKTTIAPSSPAPQGDVYVGVRKVGETTLLAREEVLSAQTSINFDAENETEYEIVAGIDKNEDDIFLNAEVCEVLAQQVLTIGLTGYADASGSAFLQNLGVGVGQFYVDQFLTAGAGGATFTQGTRTTPTLSATVFDHPFGQQWDASGNADVPFVTFPATCQWAIDFAKTSEVKGVVKDAIGRTTLKKVVNAYFATNSVSSHTFPATAWSGGIANATAWFPNLAWMGAIGGCNLSGNMWVTVRRWDKEITSLRFDGYVEDLWDGNILRDGNKEIVYTEAGYHTLGPAGRTFKHAYNFEYTWNPAYNFR